MAAFPHNLPGTQEVPKIWHLDQANQSHYPSSYVSQPPSFQWSSTANSSLSIPWFCSPFTSVKHSAASPDLPSRIKSPPAAESNERHMLRKVTTL
ncbi:hypothetical protein FOTG_19187 [Fusarium oxysporum f. sp. vasinfectum 25433]|uniref:Uncharacterized protein n=1 Tax=Fusarium oxysporum f. sp. vasinfectum 25433 TaxID=1089449 RepID=X0KU70_FUSOX|nr:hypothetical protein FOTG_19187 [Fusarium oxysporum f. sp. vasinfectum 25433]